MERRLHPLLHVHLPLDRQGGGRLRGVRSRAAMYCTSFAHMPGGPARLSTHCTHVHIGPSIVHRQGWTWMDDVSEPSTGADLPADLAEDLARVEREVRA